MTLRFLVSPTELVGDEHGRVRAIRIVRNELYPADDGTLRPRATEQQQEIPVDLVFRSVGYRGVPIPGVPFDDESGRIPNDVGRVLDRVGGSIVPGMYASGWIKRGPSGVIGTNKPDAGETVAAIAEDARTGRLPTPAHLEDAESIVRERQSGLLTFDDWKRLDALERARGEAADRPRVKYVTTDEVVAALRGT